MLNILASCVVKQIIPISAQRTCEANGASRKPLSNPPITPRTTDCATTAPQGQFRQPAYRWGRLGCRATHRPPRRAATPHRKPLADFLHAHQWVINLQIASSCRKFDSGCTIMHKMHEGAHNWPWTASGAVPTLKKQADDDSFFAQAVVNYLSRYDLWTVSSAGRASA